MNRLLILVAIVLGCATAANGQNTPVSATVVDINGHPWANGTGMWEIQCPGNSQPYINGSPVSRNQPIAGLTSSGFFSSLLWDTSFINDVNGNPQSCQWKVLLTDACNIANFSALVTGVTGTSNVDLSSQINAHAVALSPPCTPGGGSGGTVTSFSAGNLSPLFNTSVATPTVTPALSFTLLNAPANTVFGNLTGSSAPPSYQSTSAFGTLTSLSATTPIVATPSPITATGTLSCPTCLTTSLSPVKRMILPYAGCSGTTASNAWDLPASSAGVAACKTGGTNNTVQGVLQFADSAIAYYSGIVPSDWQSWGLARLSFTTNDTTSGHTIIFTLALACDTPNAGNTDDPAYGTANSFTTVTLGGSAVANASYQTSTGSLTGGGCAAGSIVHFLLERGTDTSTDTAIAATGWLEVLYSGTFQ